MEAQLDLPAPNLTISVSVDILKQNKVRELKKNMLEIIRLTFVHD